MKIKDILRLNTFYLRNNLKKLLRLMRVIILSVFTLLLVFSITHEMNKRTRDVSSDYLLEADNLKLDDSKLFLINVILNGTGQVKRLDESISRTVNTKEGQDLNVSIDKNKVCDYPSTLSLRSDFALDKDINLGDDLEVDNILYPVLNFHDELTSDKDIVMCQTSSNSFQTEATYILSVLDETQTMNIIERAKKHIQEISGSPELSVIDLNSKEIAEGLTGFLMNMIRMTTLVLCFTSLSSLSAIMKVIELERKVEFEILNYFGASKRDINSILRLSLVQIFMLCFIIAIIINLPIQLILLKY